MWFIGWEKWQVVATMWDGGVEYRDHIPEPGHGEVGSHEKWTKPDGPRDRDNILNRVGINGDDASWSSPLVVNLMTVFVEFWMMQEPGLRHAHKRSYYFIKGRPSHGKEGTLPKLGINYHSVQACIYVYMSSYKLIYVSSRAWARGYSVLWGSWPTRLAFYGS